MRLVLAECKLVTQQQFLTGVQHTRGMLNNMGKCVSDNALDGQM
jgi:hypothetical protein